MKYTLFYNTCNKKNTVEIEFHLSTLKLTVFIFLS